MKEVTKQDLEQMQDNILQAVNAGFQGVQDQFKDVQGQFEKIDERFEKMEERFDKIDERFNEMDETLQDHSEMLDGLAVGVYALQQETGSQSAINKRFEARLDRLDEHVGLEPIEV